MLIETYFDQKVSWNFLQSSMELFEQHLNNTCGSMEFHGTWATKPQVPWNSMDFFPDPKFLGIPWNFFHTPVFGIWLMIRCYLAKISQKRYILHWFRYRNSYFEHPSVSENGARSAKMACCSIYLCDSTNNCYIIDMFIFVLHLLIFYNSKQIRVTHLPISRRISTTHKCPNTNEAIPTKKEEWFTLIQE